MNHQNEFLVNHHELCTLLYNGNLKVALNLFLEHCKQLEQISLQQIRLYLSSLNHGIYNYVLIKEQISLHECCIKNNHLLLHCSSTNFANIGQSILTNYAYCREYLIEKHENEHIKRAITYINNHLSDNLSLQSVCEAISISHCYLCDLFRREVHMTFSEYVLKQRIILAKQLLRNTNLSISVIAMRCGFNTVSYFCTCFKKVEGVTPSSIKRE
jgi:YesN/AraC family two-component response regulator